MTRPALRLLAVPVYGRRESRPEEQAIGSSCRRSEEVRFLVLEHDTGWPSAELPGHAVDAALGGALLMGLALNDHIDTDVESHFVVNPGPVGKPVLYGALAQVKTENKTRSTDHRVCVCVFAAERGNLEVQPVDRLVERGNVVRGANNRLWFMEQHGGAARDGEPFREVRNRIAGVLISDEIPARRTSPSSA